MLKIYQKYIRNKELLIALVLILIFSSIMSPTFLTMSNISNILRSIAMTGTLALGLTFIMINGDFDLSFASAVSLINLIGLIVIDKGVNLFIAFLFMIVLGIAWELLNAFLVVYLKMHAFVATLATWTLADGFIYWINKGRTFYGYYPDALTYIGRHTYFNILPVNALIFIIIAIIAILIANYSKYGRWLYAVGSNSEAAEYCGIKVNRVRVMSFLFDGLTVGIAAIMMASRMASAPATAAAGSQMTVISSAFLGATAFKVGQVNVGGSILGIILLGVISNSLIMLNVPFYFQDIIQAIIIIVAVAIIANRAEGKGPAVF